MSEWLASQEMEDDMTKKFVCTLYFRDRNEKEVIQGGLNPNLIWKEMGYNSFGESVIPKIINKLIQNNLNRNYITIDSTTGNVKLTNQGRTYGFNNCY